MKTLPVCLGLLALTFNLFTGNAQSLNSGESGKGHREATLFAGPDGNARDGDFIPTGKNLIVKIHLQHPAKGHGPNSKLKLAVRAARQNGLSADGKSLLLVDAPEVKIVSPPKELPLNADVAEFTIFVDKGKLEGDTILIFVSGKGDDGQEYFGFEPYTVEDPSGHNGHPHSRTSSPIKIKLR